MRTASSTSTLGVEEWYTTSILPTPLSSLVCTMTRAPERLTSSTAESTSSGGYGGDITIYAGITLENKLNGISILEINETPGLGMNAQDVLVPQFSNKTVEIFTYTKTGSQSEGEIDAISGATRTTAAVTNAVNGALEAVREELSGGGVNE